MLPFDPDRWRALGPYLDHALELSSAARADWLVSLGAKEPALADELRSLLRAHEALDEVDFLGEAIGPMGAGGNGAASLAGQMLGAYTLRSPIGDGGMGAVWLAARSDGRYEGQVAVKLLNASLMGGLGQRRLGQERFTREGTILARLRHPAIAQLIDAGVSPGGQPYLVLEYVQGEAIDRYCDQRALGVDARLRLFLEVLAAVAYAHANLVVHRDIKPSNVLVRTDAALDPAAPRVKLLDFGIAKLLEPDAAGGGLAVTRDSGWALTPAYAAPEQLTAQPVTIATDVYSLGVLLYQLLSGQHPAGAGLRSPAELIAAVVDAEPPRLSDAVADAKTHGEAMLAAHAASRGTSPSQLRHALRGDLETIVAKALKKAPEERYASVGAFADDLRRVLEQRPIGARPDTMRYRATKFVRRNRVPVVLGVLAALGLGAGLVGTVTQAQRATRQAARADDEARLARAQRDFALGQASRAEIINDLNAFLLSEAASTPTPVTAVELLARAEQIIERQQETNEHHVEMLVSVGRQYAGLDHEEKARALLSRAYALSRAVFDDGTRARAACALAPSLARGGETDRAEQLVQEALRALPDEPQYALHRVYCALLGSDVSILRGDGKAGVERARVAEAALKAAGLSSPLLEFRIAQALAGSYSHAGRHKEALAAFADASHRLTILGRDDTLTACLIYFNWGVALQLLGRPLEAEPLFRRTVDLTSEHAAGQRSLPWVRLFAARVLKELHRWPEASDYAVRAFAKANGEGNHLIAVSSLLVQAASERQLGHLARAEDLLAQVEPRLNRLPSSNTTMGFAQLAGERAQLAAARGDTQEALALTDRAIALAESARRQAWVARFLVGRSELALRLDRAEQARADAARALGIEQQTAEVDATSCDRGRAHLALGRALRAQNRPIEARIELSAAIAQLTPTLGADHPETRAARQLADAVASR